MKQQAYFATIALCILLCEKAISASVSWPAMELYSYGLSGGVYSALLNSTIQPYIAGVWLDISNVDDYNYKLEANVVTAASGIFLYQAFNGDAVTVDSVLEATPLAENLASQWPRGSASIALGEVFYLCFWMGNGGGDVFPGDPSSVYGWASLVWDGTTLTLLDSAAETTGVGIFAGTYDPVPEPSTAGLLAAGLAALALRRRRRSA